MTYRWVEHASTDIRKDGNIDSESSAESEGDVDQFGNLLDEIHVWVW